MKTTTKDLTKGTIWKQLIAFAIPLIWGNLFQLTYNMVDSIVVGQFAGQDALAAVVEVVRRQLDLVVEEAEGDADVALGFDLPVDVVVDETQVVNTGAHAVRG